MSESISFLETRSSVIADCRETMQLMHIVNLTLNQTNLKPSTMSRLLMRKTEKQIGYS